MSGYPHQILRLENPVMEYAWGSETFIPELLGGPAPAGRPAAELWMGAHPRAPSRVKIDGRPIPLDRLIGEDPEGTLGPRTAGRFQGKLPFLFKILAVERPLSIQAHPDREQARAGFLRENAAGTPIDAPDRNYRDPQPKPELLCALTPFEALCGFREPGEIAAAVSELELELILPEAGDFCRSPDRERLRRLFRALLTLPAPEKNSLLGRIGELAGEKREVTSVSPRVRDLAARLGKLYPGDLGVLGPIFLNLVQLEPEEAVYLAPGVLHAYLRGAGVELMAGSDNVLRGGLTAKHIDGAELANILSCRCGPAAVGRAEPGDGVEFIYRSPAAEYQLSRILPTPPSPFRSGHRRGPEIVFCYRGRARAAGQRGPAVELVRGDSVFIPFGAGMYSLRGEAVLYRASLPESGS